MTAFRFQAFTGETPRTANRLLPDGRAQRASNVRLTNGNIEPLYQPKLIPAGLCALPRSIYRMYSGGASYWLSWPYDVDVAKGPIAGDERFRIYFTSSAFEPRCSDIGLATNGAPYPGKWYALGVTPPISKPAAVADGGSGANEERAYVTTFVTAWGEESAPSPASDIVTGKPDAVWTVSGLDPLPPNGGAVQNATVSAGVATLTLDTVFGLRKSETVRISGIAGLSGMLRIQTINVANKTITLPAPNGISGSSGTWMRDAPHNTDGMKRRLYRTVSTAGGTDYYFVKEFDFGTLSVVDDAGANVGEPIPTVGWEMPPADLQGVRVHPSGALVGFRGNEVCFSEPLAPYAWVQDYRNTTDYPVVGIGVFGISVVVGTAGQPYLVQGVDPASMSAMKLEQRWPSLSKRSFADMGNGVAYAAPQGLVMVGPGGAALATEQTFTFDEWREFSPEQMAGEAFDGRYHCSYPGGMLVIDGDSMTRSNWLPEAIYTDHETGVFYVVVNGNLYEWNGEEGVYMAAEWHSKEVLLPTPINLGAAKLDAKFYFSAAERQAQLAAQAAQLATNQALIAAAASRGSLNGASLNTFSLNGSQIKKPIDVGDFGQVVFSLYVDGDLWFQTTRADDKPFRLPDGKKYDNFSVRVAGNVEISSIVVGSSIKALREI